MKKHINKLLGVCIFIFLLSWVSVGWGIYLEIHGLNVDTEIKWSVGSLIIFAVATLVFTLIKYINQ